MSKKNKKNKIKPRTEIKTGWIQNLASFKYSFASEKEYNDFVKILTEKYG